MKNEKKNKDVVFNPSDYAYMDNMPLEGWIWEFIRRNDDYYWYYFDFEELKNKNDKRGLVQLMDNNWDLANLPFQLKNPLDKWFEGEEIRFDELSKFNPVDAVNLKWGVSNIQVSEGGKTVSLKESARVVYLKPHADVFSLVRPEGEPKRLEFGQEYDIGNDHPFDLLLEQQGNENIIMALVDISAPESIDNILKELKSSLLKWRNALKLPKIKDAKTAKKNENLLIGNAKIWKSYIIIYDLMSNGLSYKEVCNMLIDYDDSYKEEKFIERHLKAAEKIINGGYKKYL